MKKCTKCKIEKSESDFYKKKTSSDGLQFICKACTKEYHKTHYRDHKRMYLSNVKKTKNRNSEFFNRVRKMSKCRCGEDKWYTLQFHHVNGKSKGISKMVNDGHSIEGIKKEMRRCILLCANCHIEEHFKIRQSTQVA